MEDPNQPQPGQPPPSQPPPGQPPPSQPPPGQPPPPPSAPQAPPGYGAPSAPKTGQPPLSIVSLVTGILGVLTFWCCIGWPASIAAIVTGILGRRQAPERGASPTMATIGLILGIAGIVIAIGWAVLVGISGGFNADFDTS